MSSPASTRASAPLQQPVGTIHRVFPKLTRTAKITLAVVATVVVLALLVGSGIWPFAEKAVLQDLAEASDSTVTIRAFHRTYFPSPGCILEGLEFHHGQAQFTLGTIEKLTVAGSYAGMLSQRVPRITVEGGHVLIPPFGSNVSVRGKHSGIVINEIVANGTVVEFASRNPQKPPLRFEIHQALLRDVGWDRSFSYQLKVHNPQPPGEITTTGKFGPWTTGSPGVRPISGEYTFEQVDLSVYGGIDGVLASKGSFSGELRHINIAGDTDTPDFEVTSGDHQVKLDTKFDAFVDGVHGDTFLKRVDAQFGRTHLLADGSVAGVQGRKGKVAQINIESRRGRIEDLLELFIKDRRPPMSGAIALKAKVEIPSGDDPFLQKVKLQGAFGIDDGSFAPETQKSVNVLSAGARGENKDDPQTVLTDLKGRVVLAGGIASFSEISFGIPGAAARMHGTYNILNHKIDLHGTMRVDTKISQTTTGMKALMLKVMDPIFKKRKKGEIVPIHIAGTYEHPQFGLDLEKSDAKGKGKAAK